MPTRNMFTARLSYSNRVADAEDFFRDFQPVKFNDKICEFTNISKAEYLPGNYESNLPERSTTEIETRSAGNARLSAMRGYDSFFKPFSAETLLEDIPSRHKTLHLGVVFGMSVANLNALLRDLSFRPLSTSNPFELTIWGFLGLLEARKVPKDRNNLANLQKLYEDVCIALEENRDNIIDSPSNGDETSTQSMYLSVDLGKSLHTFFSSHELTRENFLDYIKKNSPILRYHVKSSEHAFSGTLTKLVEDCHTFDGEPKRNEALKLLLDECNKLDQMPPPLSSENQAILAKQIQDIRACRDYIITLPLCETSRQNLEVSITTLRDALSKMTLLANDLSPENQMSRTEKALSEGFANVKEILSHLPDNLADPGVLREEMNTLTNQFKDLFQILPTLVPKDSKTYLTSLKNELIGANPSKHESSLIGQLKALRRSNRLTRADFQSFTDQILEYTKQLEEISLSTDAENANKTFLKGQEKYQHAVKNIEKQVNTTAQVISSIPNQYKKLMREEILGLYQFWAPFSDLNLASFQETIRRILDGNHAKSPSRELLILTKLYYELKTDPRQLHESTINNWLGDIGQPALTYVTKFDRLIKRLLSTPVTNVNEFKTLLSAYDAAHKRRESTPLLNFQMSEQATFSLLRLVFKYVDGGKAAGLEVTIRGEEEKTIRGKTEKIIITRTRKTNPAGIVTFQNIPFGSYEVLFDSNEETVTFSKNKPSFTQRFTV